MEAKIPVSFRSPTSIRHRRTPLTPNTVNAVIVSPAESDSLQGRIPRACATCIKAERNVVLIVTPNFLPVLSVLHKHLIMNGTISAYDSSLFKNIFTSDRMRTEFSVYRLDGDS